MRGQSLSQNAVEFLGLWIPKDLAALMDRAVFMDDTDRSKFVRAAIRERIAARRQLASKDGK